MPFTPPQRQSWIWAAIPAGVDRVCAPNDPDLRVALEGAGIAAGPESAEVALLSFPRPRRSPPGEVLAAAHGVEVVAVTVGGGHTDIRDRVPRLRLALERAGVPLLGALSRLAGRRIAGALAGRGFEVSTFEVSDRSRNSAELGRSLLRHGSVPAGVLVVGRMRARPTVLEAVVAEAARAAGAELSVRRVRMVETGKLVVQLEGASGEGYVLRLAGRVADELLETSVGAIRAIAGANPPASVRERLVEPIATGVSGPVRYSLEPLVAGSHPRALGPELWEQCLDFLIGLHGVHGAARRGPVDLAGEVELMGRHAAEPERAVLRGLEARLGERLGEVALGFGHGDFWLENLMVEDGRLSSVLDWDTATPASLPMLDLMDLLSLAQWRNRGLMPGPRLTKVLLPFARAGGDERTRRYCQGTGTPADRPTLEALAVAYWINRTARDLRDTPDRKLRPRWIEQNLRAPLRELARWR